ncbi:MAG: hypothetical protein RL391_1611 [Actinomycetota bacterium]
MDPITSEYALGVDFSGARVVVTGAAGGIGAALARRFHGLGSRVVLTDLHEGGVTRIAAELDALRPGSAFAVAADIGTENGNHQLIDAARGFLGGIDLFFANAGVGTGGFVESTTESEWALAFDVNIHAHRWAAKFLLPEWLERGSGYFCSTASAAGILSQIGSAPYSVTKHAAVAFAEWMSISYGDRGIKVSCLCPQGVNTNMLNGGELGENGATNVVRAAGDVLEPEYVAEIVSQAIVAERFLILPHPQVADFEQRKAADRDRWLAGMRKLQARVLGEL